MDTMHVRPYVQRLGHLIYCKRGEGRDRYVRSLRDVAREADVSPATLSRIERGAAPDLETFRKLCLWLGVSADEVLGLRQDTPA